MAELVMRKRRARAGEVGLFVDAEIWADDFATLKMDAEVEVKATGTGSTQKYIAFSWIIAQMVCDASDNFDTKEDAREALLIECRHFRRRFDKLRQKAEIIAKPTSKLDQTDWIRLIRRMVHVAVTQYGIPDEALNHDMPMERTAR